MIATAKGHAPEFNKFGVDPIGYFADSGRMLYSKTAAAIDVGSNSIKVLVARRHASTQAIETVFTHTIETRISAGISRSQPRLSDDAIARGTATVLELYRQAQAYKPDSIQIVATSAVRDALNGSDFVAAVAQATGIQLRILSGPQEASYIGKGLACDPAIQGIDRFIQMDLGGGSLELIRFHAGRIEQAISLQLGAVRLCEQFIEDQEVALSEAVERSIRSYVAQALEDSAFDFSPCDSPLIATGGAFTVCRAVLAAAAGSTLDAYKASLTRGEITQLKQRLAPLPLAERKKVPQLPPARADIVPTALITIEQVLQTAGRDSVLHSLYNLRYGIVAEQLDRLK